MIGSEVIGKVSQIGQGVARDIGGAAGTLLFRQGNGADYDDYDDRNYPILANQAKEWIDGRVHDGLGTAYRGALQVLSAGFGKGLLVAAAIATIATVALAITVPGAVGLTEGLSLAQSVQGGMTAAGNFLLGKSAGYFTLFAGGAVGSLVAAHTENTRIGREEAERQAREYEQKRAGLSLQPTLTPQQEVEHCKELVGGHCARLMQARKAQQNTEQGVA